MALLVILGALGAWLLSAASAYAADEPVVTFAVIGNPPAVCGSRPNVSTLAVTTGAGIVVVNDTGLAAQVAVGGVPVLAVPEGGGALLVLEAGQHEVRLAPECAKVNSGVPLVVTVAAPGTPSPTSGPPSPSGSPSPDARTDPSGPAGPAGAAGGTSAAGSAGSQDDGDPGGSSSAGASADVLVADGASSTSRTSTRSTGVVSVTPIDFDAALVNSKEVRLVGAIAVICVLGVTAAIIRSIVRLIA